ncbi:hypothetical protein M5D96_014124 [Drosophila gunungcola]|uniref:Uncharacterized protein n=1 Tax=Drosophila gunungcola TaxID=103775 RepID=A0A9Q0BIY6_9MUSC|nr:hypothetical protein M5D96_014124 [Drosophila gunungcola]
MSGGQVMNIALIIDGRRLNWRMADGSCSSAHLVPTHAFGVVSEKCFPRHLHDGGESKEVESLEPEPETETKPTQDLDLGLGGDAQR